jgi:hypothetical protein
MGFLDWMRKKDGGAAAVVKEQSVSLSYGERCALRRMTQHFDDGLVGCKHGGDWEKTFDKMAERLSLRPRDPFGDQPVSISAREAEALRKFQKVYEEDANGVYPGNQQMQSDAEAVRHALEREGKPETPSVISRPGKGQEIEF